MTYIIMITAMNTAAAETPNEITGKHDRTHKPRGISDILELCDN